MMVSKNQYILKLVDRIKEKIHKENEMFLIFIYGEKGSGKTMASQEIGMLIDPTLDIERVCFTKEEFIQMSLKHKQKVIIGDEGIQLFFNRASMTKEAREINAFMEQCRILNNVLIINIPKLLSIDPMILQDANLVIWTWKGKKDGKVTKENLAFFPKLNKNNYVDKLLRHLQRKKNNRKTYPPTPAFTELGNPIGKKKEYPVGTVKYNHKRFKVLKKYSKNVDNDVKKDLIIQIKKKYPEVTDETIGKVFNLRRETVNRLRNKPVTPYTG